MEQADVEPVERAVEAEEPRCPTCHQPIGLPCLSVPKE
jgi:hypothetical protein